MDLRESRCEDCTEICGCGEEIACRVWQYKGEDYDVAPVPVLLNALMSAVYSSTPREVLDPVPSPQLPKNLQKFFAAKRPTAQTCCSQQKDSTCCAPEETSACCGAGISQPATCGCQ